MNVYLLSVKLFWWFLKLGEDLCLLHHEQCH